MDDVAPLHVPQVVKRAVVPGSPASRPLLTSCLDTVVYANIRAGIIRVFRVSESKLETRPNDAISSKSPHCHRAQGDGGCSTSVELVSKGPETLFVVVAGTYGSAPSETFLRALRLAGGWNADGPWVGRKIPGTLAGLCVAVSRDGTEAAASLPLHIGSAEPVDTGKGAEER